jgi:hypothetical protein
VRWGGDPRRGDQVAVGILRYLRRTFFERTTDTLTASARALMAARIQKAVCMVAM